MEYIYVGDIVNTHGLKGELRIISDFEYKDKIFKPDFKIYVGHEKEELVIRTYRPHKIYEMVTLDGVNDINDAIIYKGDQVYINRADLDINSYLDEDLIGINVYSNDKLIGQVSLITSNKAHKILVVNNDNHRYLIPNVPAFIKKIDLKNRTLEINEIEGLLNEN
jgi:16S rRNA processing protein RimM